MAVELGIRLVWAAFPTVVSSVIAAIALLVLYAAPRRPANQWLAMFLLLVAGNYATQALSFFLEAGWNPPHADALAERLAKLGTVFLVLDPFFLAYFASIFPMRRGIAMRPIVLAFMAIVASLFLLAEIVASEFTRPYVGGEIRPVGIAFFVYLSSCYLYAAWTSIRSATEVTSGVMARQARAVAFAILIVTVPRVATVFSDPPFYDPLTLLVGLLLRPLAEIVLRTGLLALLWAVFFLSYRRSTMGPLIDRVGVIFVLIGSIWIAARLPVALSLAGVEVGDLSRDASERLDHGLVFTVRWFLFGGAMVVAFLREEALLVDVFRSPLALLSALATVALTLLVAAVAGGAIWVAILGVVMTFAAFALGRRSREPWRIPERREAAPDELDGSLETIRRLGDGSQGFAVLARERTTGSLVVVKRLRQLGNEQIQIVRRELLVARSISHPRLVDVHDVRMRGGAPEIVMEYVSGGDLSVALREGTLSPELLQIVVQDVASALAALHDAGIVHGDIKPENVLLDANRRGKLADFGLASFDSRSTLVDAPGFRGTVAYAAPELLRGAKASPATDVFALSKLLLECPIALSERARAALARGLDPDPHRRPSATELASALEPEH